MADYEQKRTARIVGIMAKKYGWSEIDHQENIMMISFLKGVSRINIYYAREWRMTVATIVNHPAWGRRQLFRKYIRMHELENIFKNPRVHTDRGYYQRHGKVSKQKVAKTAVQEVPDMRTDTAGVQGPEYSF